MLRIIQGDALTELRKLPAESVHCCVTSPPLSSIECLSLPPEAFTFRNIFVREREISHGQNFTRPMRELTSPGRFASMLARFGLKSTKHQRKNCLFFLNTKKRKQRLQALLCKRVGNLPAKKRSSIIAVGLLGIVLSTQLYRQKFNRSFVNHSHLNASMVTWCRSMSFYWFALFNSNVAFAVDQSGEISNVDLIHKWDYVTIRAGDVKYG